MTDQWSERLSELLDGDLPPAEREACERHVAVCAECMRDLESLRAVVSRAGALGDRTPAPDLWPAIEARLRERVPGRTRVLRLPRWSARFSLTVPQAAAAALLLVALSAGAVWWALRGATPAPGDAGQMAASGAPAKTAPRVLHGAADASLAGFDETRYDAAIADLEGALRDHRAELDTSTVRVLEQNLAIIDRAIAQARSALAADPASSYLHGHLVAQMMLKMDLLRRATAFHDARG